MDIEPIKDSFDVADAMLNMKGDWLALSEMSLAFCASRSIVEHSFGFISDLAYINAQRMQEMMDVLKGVEQ